MFCYCGSAKNFIQCCQPYLTGTALPESSLLLMRSRYSAYCIKAIDYLYATSHPDSRAANSPEQIAQFANSVHFLSLQILPVKKHLDTEVSFYVRYLQQNMVLGMQETSRFVLLDKWYYVDGKLTEHIESKIGRNNLCPCLSGLKYKHCKTHLPSGTPSIHR